MNYQQLLEQLRRDLPVSSSNNFQWPPWTHLVIWGLVLFFFLFFLRLSFFTVGQQRFRIVTRFGKHLRVVRAGLHMKLPLIDRVKEAWSLEITQKVVKVETITKDKVTVVLLFPIQYFFIEGREYDAFWKVGNVIGRLEATAFDLIRSNVTALTLDELFSSKDELAIKVQNELKADLDQFGIGISRVLITSIEPDAKVKSAMNDINAALKTGEAELAKAQNEKRIQVAQAQARLDAADLNKQAEIKDAEGVAASMKIIEDSLGGPENYLRYKWIEMMDNRDAGDTIYVATEGSLPILEAGVGMEKRLQTKK